MVRHFLALAAILACLLAGGRARALDPAHALTQYQHQSWTYRDGMPGFVLAITQTPDGYLWIGTTAGLFRFDGQHFDSFTALTSGVEVAALLVTRSGDLWVASKAQIIRRHDGVFRPMPPTRFPGDGYIRYLSAGVGEDVWAATDAEVARFNGRVWRTIPANWGSAEAYHNPGGVWAMRVDEAGVVWTKNVTSLYFLRPGGDRFEKAKGYGGGVFDFARAPDGRLWTSDMISKRFYALPRIAATGPAGLPAQVGAPVPSAMMGWAVFDRDGALWCANGVTGGLYRVRSVTAADVGEAFTHEQGLTSATPHPVFEDREGDIWVGTTGGLDRFSPANVLTEPRISVWGVSAELGGSPDEIYLSDGRQPPGLPHSVQSLYRIGGGPPQRLPLDMQDGGLISGSLTGGALIGFSHRLVWLRNAKAEEIALPPGAKTDAPTSATRFGDDIWLFFEKAGLFHRHSGGPWTQVGGVGAGSERWIRTDREGSLWLFNATQIQRLRDGRWDFFGKGSGAPTGYVRSFLAQPGGFLIAGEFGLSEFDGRQFHTLSPERVPFLEQTVGIVADDLGGMWFRSITGIFRVPASQLEKAFTDPTFRLDPQLYDSRDGLNSPELFNGVGDQAAKGPDGRLWFLNSASLNWIDPHHLYRNAMPPPVNIQAVTVGGHVLPGGALLKLRAGTSNLQIDYAALSLQNPERVRYRYRLEGVDAAWVDAGGRRQAFYTRLQPGRYRFRVIAANNNGVWNDTGATQAFEIPPTFVQSIWFLLLCGALALAALSLAFRWRVQRVTAALQSRNDERIAERQRIARELHDTLLQGFQGLVLRFQAIMERLPADQPARAQIGETLERADEVLIAGRDRVSQLRALEAGDLAVALASAARAASVHANARFHFLVRGTARPVHPIVMEELDAIGAEAITNAFRHANADTIQATLNYGQTGVTLDIADDGVGIDSQVLAQGGREGHFGFTGMRERAEKLGAKLAISSEPGRGATIRVTLPAKVAYLPDRSPRRARLHQIIGRLINPSHSG